MYALIRPRIVVPMHGEARHLKAHARLARECGVSETITPIDGEIVRLWPDPAGVIDEAPVGRLYRDGNLIVPDVEGPVKARRKLSFVGIVVVSMAMSRRGEILRRTKRRARRRAARRRGRRADERDRARCHRRHAAVDSRQAAQ